jgi:hypothetical protein
VAEVGPGVGNARAGNTDDLYETKERRMSRRQFLFVFALAVAVFLTATSSVLAAQTHNDTITGHEYYFTSTDGRFAGTATGSLPGAWNADVRHTALCLSCTPTATITGGSFSLATTYTLITGRFTGGTVQVINRGADCTNQTFDVDGILGDVGRFGGSGTGRFSVILTHYRHRILGSCISYAASVRGMLTLTF